MTGGRPRGRNPERTRAAEVEVEGLRRSGLPLGGVQTWPDGHSTLADRPYPLICVCPVPVPEWVYVAHQCATCKRVIKEAT